MLRLPDLVGLKHAGGLFPGRFRGHASTTKALQKSYKHDKASIYVYVNQVHPTHPAAHARTSGVDCAEWASRASCYACQKLCEKENLYAQ